MTDLQAQTTPELHTLKNEYRKVMHDKNKELRIMRNMGAREDIDGILRHLDWLNREVEAIDEELTRRRLKREAREARQNQQRDNRR